ncbi:DUF1643 domain-containing protein [Primorskyibacter flagellatus]|uniref:DUF1643 domain-containing protein n=1 Tax=Primorskyibacter flagellatus TaxID=1387277 RepID=A0A1W2APE0_9RHOB|nr:DUF1643 domain-containing protein [Primorskyibacter flagellatus]SMC62577.1 hypothetical protein SAMN06295998_103180 [Primorskyibacter flagellatus]
MTKLKKKYLGDDAHMLHDPGGKVRINLPDGVIGGATYSSCGRYRQVLTRDWTPEGTEPRTIMFVGQNPSVATAEVSDPTCDREVGFARRWGFTRYVKTNMLDWRATEPKNVPHDPELACSQENLAAILREVEDAEEILLAYGKLHKRFVPIVGKTLDALKKTGKPLNCLKLNKDGSAGHPLYISSATERFPFPEA